MCTKTILRVLLVPAFILLATALYWFSIQGASGGARRVPDVVIIFIIIMVAVVIIQDIGRLAGRCSKQVYAGKGALPDALRCWLRAQRQRLFFVAISLTYFPLFVSMGFNIANFLFLVLVLPVSGLADERSFGARAGLVLCVSLVSTLVFHMLAKIMDFNVPTSPFGF